MMLYENSCPDSYECPTCGKEIKYTLKGMINHNCKEKNKK